MDPTDKRLSLHCTQVMPTQIFKSNKKEWIRMVSKTLTALKTENPNGIPQDDLIEQVIFSISWTKISSKISRWCDSVWEHGQHRFQENMICVGLQFWARLMTFSIQQLH